jgi:hypothetical protein
MRKVFLLLMAVGLVAVCPLAAYAEDVTETDAETAETVTEAETTEETVTDEETAEEATEEATEAPTEAEETTVEEVTTETEEATEEATDELDALLNVATPEDIEKIKNYIIYGVSVLPFSEKATMFILENINPISWVVVGLIIAVAVVVYLAGNKKQYDDNVILNDNAIEAYKASAADSKQARAMMEEIAVALTRRMEEAERAAQSREESNLSRMDEHMAKVLADAAETVRKATEAMQDVANRETAVTESTMMVCRVIQFLTDHSKAIPEWDRDNLNAMLAEATAKIEEVTRHGETGEK